MSGPAGATLGAPGRPSVPRRSVPRVVLAVVATALALLLTVGVEVPLTRLHAGSLVDRTDAEVVADALPRLAFLHDALDDGAAPRMQELFPEGYFFTWCLYGLTWLDVGARAPSRRDDALREARRALAALDSPAGRAPFEPAADPPYGVFAAGWSSWLRGGIVQLGGPDATAAERDRLHTDARALTGAFTRGFERGTPYLAAYPDQAWPVDSTVGMAAVVRADRVLGVADAGLRTRWSAAVRQRLDPATGLLPHRVDPATGRPVEGARATSLTVALRFLREVDPAWAARDAATFTRLFTADVPGVPGVREHPRGVDRPGDVDSGPLVLGMSTSASAVALGDAILFGDRRRAAQLAGLADAAGVPVEIGGERRYLGGVVPVGDAFLAWSLAARPWVAAPARPSGTPGAAWRLPWYLTAALLLLPAWTGAVLALRRPRPLRTGDPDPGPRTAAGRPVGAGPPATTDPDPEPVTAAATDPSTPAPGAPSARSPAPAPRPGPPG